MRKLFWAPLLLVVVLVASAEPPPEYYTSAQGKAGPALASALHAVISGHTVIPYSSSSRLDTSDALAVLDEDPANTNNVLTIYAGESEPKSTFGQTTSWNREHRWCNAYGLDGQEPAYSDLFNLHAEDYNANSSHGDKYYDVSDPASPNYRNPAHVEALLCTSDTDSWEPPAFAKGDIARSIFYMAVRYTGDRVNEPALHLTDDATLIRSTNSYMGRLSTLRAWHEADPVSPDEQARTEKIYSRYQHNRNPFVDHPEWVNLIFAPACHEPPVLDITSSSGHRELSWLATNQSSHLESSAGISGPWIDVPVLPVLTNARFFLVWTNDETRFFRLRVD